MVIKLWRQADVSLRGHYFSSFQTSSNDLMMGRTVNMIAVGSLCHTSSSCRLSRYEEIASASGFEFKLFR